MSNLVNRILIYCRKGPGLLLNVKSISILLLLSDKLLWQIHIAWAQWHTSHSPAMLFYSPIVVGCSVAFPCCACDCHLSAPFTLFLTYVYQNTAFAWPCQSQKRKTMPSFCQWQSSGGGHLCCVKYKHPHFLLVMTSLGHNGRVGGVRVDRSFVLWCMNKIQLGLRYVRQSIPLTNLHWKHHIIVSQYFLQ